MRLFSITAIVEAADEADAEAVSTLALKYSFAVDSNDTAVVKVVSGETEAEVVCGLLRTAGIECGYRDTAAIDGPFEGLTESGPREVFVLKSDLEAAHAALAGS